MIEKSLNKKLTTFLEIKRIIISYRAFQCPEANQTANVQRISNTLRNAWQWPSDTRRTRQIM